MRSCFVALALTLSAAEGVSAQVRAEDLTRTLAQLRSAADALPRRARNAENRIKSAIDWLNNRASKDPQNVSEEYLRSLQRAGELLRQRPLSVEVIEDVLAELEAKVDHCKLLGIGMGGSVVLRINTRRPSGPVGNWQVLSLLKIYERVNGASPVTFPKLSTPTESRLDPGRYWIWAREPATGRTTEPTLVRVVGQKELLVDLPVP